MAGEHECCEAQERSGIILCNINPRSWANLIAVYSSVQHLCRIKFMKKKKHSQIIELLENKNVMSIRELAEQLNCTEMTVRRNLDELQEMNFVKRERGFATLLSLAKPTEYLEQSAEHAAEKKAIAQAAMRYIKEGDVICLDSGTTTQQLVLAFPKDLSLSLITTSLEAAVALAEHKNVQVMLPGGQMHHRNRSILIENPEEMKRFCSDVAFLSCRSLRIPGGAFEHSQALTATKKALASIAAKRILLLDHSKWGVSSLCSSIRLEDIDVIITDTAAPSDSVEEARARGIEVVLAAP